MLTSPRSTTTQITDNVVPSYNEVMCQSLTRSQQLETHNWIGYSLYIAAQYYIHTKACPHT